MIVGVNIARARAIPQRKQAIITKNKRLSIVSGSGKKLTVICARLLIIKVIRQIKIAIVIADFMVRRLDFIRFSMFCIMKM